MVWVVQQRQLGYNVETTIRVSEGVLVALQELIWLRRKCMPMGGVNDKGFEVGQIGVGKG